MKFSKFGLIALMTIFSFASPDRLVSKSVETKCWMNIEYVKCLQKKFPCECEASTKSYFVLIADTSLTSKHFGIRWRGPQDNEFGQLDLRKESKNKYNVIDHLEQTVGSILLKKDKLYFFDSKNHKSIFVPFGRSESDGTPQAFINDETQYLLKNISVLNKAFIRRDYPSLEVTLGEDSLSCSCNKDLGSINLVSGRLKSWIIEQGRDSVFIYDHINSGGDKVEPPRIDKKLYKRYKW